jgi:hypothetical protein
VALFDYDNDGRLDIFFSNSGRIDEPMPKDAIPQKDSPKYWNRLYHQKSDGTFERCYREGGRFRVGYSTGIAVGDYDNDGHEDLSSPDMAEVLSTTTTAMGRLPMLVKLQESRVRDGDQCCLAGLRQ